MPPLRQTLVAQGRRSGRSSGRPRDGETQADPAFVVAASRRFDRALALAFAGRLRSASAALDAVPDSDHARWLRAYLAGASGDFGAGERICRALLEHADDVIARGRAAVTLGSILRQTDRHAPAREIEAAALETAPSPELIAHLSIGLAADAAGLGDVDAVDVALRRAASSHAGGWRSSVRRRWVRCERELLVGRPARAAAHARAALELARRSGARRHEAKSMLFLGASLRDVAALAGGSRGLEARTEADRALRLALSTARRIGAVPVEAVAEELLGRR